MHNNDGSYYFGGMHMGWWILILVLVIVLVGGYSRSRKSK